MPHDRKKISPEQISQSAPPGFTKRERVITTPQQCARRRRPAARRAEYVRQQLPRPGRPPGGPRGGARGARRLGLRHGQRPFHLRHAATPQATGSGRWPNFSAPRTRFSIPPAWTPMAGCSRRCLAAEDAVISDELNHASIIDGVRLCKAQRFRYRNNDMADLEAKLQEAAVRAVPADCHRRRLFDGRHDRQPAGDLRSGRPLRRAGDGRRFARRRFPRAGRPRHARVSRRDGPHRHPHRHARQGPGRRAAAATPAAGGRSSNLLRQRSRPYLFSNSLPPPIVGGVAEVAGIAHALDGTSRRLDDEHGLVPPGDDRRRLPDRARRSTQSCRSCSATPVLAARMAEQLLAREST